MYLQGLCKVCQSLSKRKFFFNRTNNEAILARPNQIKQRTYKSVYYLVRKKQISCFSLDEINLTKLTCKRTFHSSNPNKALPPIIWIALRSVLRLAAIITGRGLRKWWASLPKNKRTYIVNQLKRNQQKIMIAGALSCGAVYTYYIMHLVEDPITKRKKFLIFTENQIIQMATIECDVLLENLKGQIIKSGYHYNNVLVVTKTIINANRHLPGTNKNWQVFIVNDSETKNAFVLPSGHIFIFTGMLAVISNQDQLAAVIAHEIAHSLLSHSAEMASKNHLLEMLTLLPLVALWSLFPDSVALFSHYVTEYVIAVLFQLPFSRSLESEADVVGLRMLSRACYDPKQASLFWKKMEHIAEDGQVEWLSTHPSHQSRYNTLDELMPAALKIVDDHCTKKDVNPHPFSSRIPLNYDMFSNTSLIITLLISFILSILLIT